MHPSPHRGCTHRPTCGPYPSNGPRQPLPAGVCPSAGQFPDPIQPTREDMLGASRGPQWLRRQPWARGTWAGCSGAPEATAGQAEDPPAGPLTRGDSVRWKPSQVQATDSSRCSSGSTVAAGWTQAEECNLSVQSPKEGPQARPPRVKVPKCTPSRSNPYPQKPPSCNKAGQSLSNPGQSRF